MAKFASRYANHTLCIEPSHHTQVAGKLIFHKAKVVQFGADGRLDTDKKNEIDFLRKHDEFGINIFEEKEKEEKKEE